MCGRYLFYDQKNARIREMLKILREQINETELRDLCIGEIFPSQLTPVAKLQEDGQTLKLVPMRWGIRHPSFNRQIINARSETAGKSPLFAESLKQRRCVICASGYYEWQKPEKKKMLLTLPAEAPLYMAGFFRIENGEPHFVIMTRAALPKIAAIHDRMPVILSETGAVRYCRGENLLHCAPELNVRVV